MQRRLAAILHADVAGYSRLMAGDEQGTLADLKSRLDLLTEIITGYSGRICNTAGDAVLAEFPSVSAAVSAAIDTQRRIAALNRDTPADQRLDLRIGINLGEVMADEDGQIYGTGVNVAARLQALAEPGQITISGRAKEQVDHALAIGFASMGQRRVKNIPTPVQAFRIVADGTGPSPRSASSVNRRRLNRIVAALCVGMAALGATVIGLWTYNQTTTVPSGDGPAPTARVVTTLIGVLPFRNVSGDPAQDYFAGALTEDLTNALGRFAEFSVVAREALAGIDNAIAKPRDIHREFGVAYLLGGSVRRDDDTVRLIVKLIDATTGQQVWSERYDRPLEKLFAVQDEIVRTVASEAAITLGRIESERVFGKAIPDLEAYDLYIRGRTLTARETREDNIEARHLFRLAIEKDPHYALAHVGLAWTYYLEATRGWSQFMSRNVAETEAQARRALRLDPLLPEAFEVLGYVSLLRGEYEQSEAELRRAIELNPNSLGTLQGLGNTLTFLGHAEDAVRVMERAASLGALPSSRSFPILALAYVLSGDPERAIRFLDKYGGERRDHFYYAALAIAYAELSDADKAKAAGRETLRAWPFFDPRAFARQFRDPKDQERIADDLRKAGLG